MDFNTPSKDLGHKQYGWFKYFIYNTFVSLVFK